MKRMGHQSPIQQKPVALSLSHTYVRRTHTKDCFRRCPLPGCLNIQERRPDNSLLPSLLDPGFSLTPDLRNMKFGAWSMEHGAWSMVLW
jgi:hypothetical protein